MMRQFRTDRQENFPQPSSRYYRQSSTFSRPQPRSFTQFPATARCQTNNSTFYQQPPPYFVRHERERDVRQFDKKLSEDMWCYHKSVEQTETMLNRKLQLRDLIYYTICPIFPMCGLYVVGSSLNGFGTNSSDMDLCLVITNKDLDQKTDAVVVLNMVLCALTGIDFVTNQQLILAKVPILRLKFTAPFDDITVDLNANNSVAIKNTHLLCYYSSFDWRVRPLVTVVKEWARRKGINDANRSSFTSYSLVLMVIHYLQCGCQQPVLPSLQKIYPKIFKTQCDVRALNVTSCLPKPNEHVFRFENRASLAELLIGFFHYYASRFDFNTDAISVRLGRRVSRAAVATNWSSSGMNTLSNGSGTPAGTNKSETSSDNGGDNAEMTERDEEKERMAQLLQQQWIAQWRCICIEEPFTLGNTAHSIYDEMVFEEIKQAFREAYVQLKTVRDLNSFLQETHSINVNRQFLGRGVVYQPQAVLQPNNTMCEESNNADVRGPESSAIARPTNGASLATSALALLTAISSGNNNDNNSSQ